MDKKPPFSEIVKEYTEERYVFDKKGNEILDFKYIWKYNENNNISEVHRYNSKNKLTDISHYTYNDVQNILEVIVRTPKGSKKQSMFYKYNCNKLIEISNIAKSFKTISKFDNAGNLIEEAFYRDSNSSPYITRYKNVYNRNKQLIEKWIILASGELDSTIIYEYNDAGLLIQENKTNNKTTYKIDEKELRISKNSISKYTYNDRGDTILSEYESEGFGKETHKKEITYNEFNDIVQIKDYSKGYAYIWKDDFGLMSVTNYFYKRL
jgi:hypothetical protein